MQRAKKRPFRRVFHATRSFNGRGGGKRGGGGVMIQGSGGKGREKKGEVGGRE